MESDPHPDEVTALLNFNSATSLTCLKLHRKQIKQLPTTKKYRYMYSIHTVNHAYDSYMYVLLITLSISILGMSVRRENWCSRVWLGEGPGE